MPSHLQQWGEILQALTVPTSPAASGASAHPRSTSKREHSQESRVTALYSISWEKYEQPCACSCSRHTCVQYSSEEIVSCSHMNFSTTRQDKTAPSATKCRKICAADPQAALHVITRNWHDPRSHLVLLLVHFRHHGRIVHFDNGVTSRIHSLQELRFFLPRSCR